MKLQSLPNCQIERYRSQILYLRTLGQGMINYEGDLTRNTSPLRKSSQTSTHRTDLTQLSELKSLLVSGSKIEAYIHRNWIKSAPMHASKPVWWILDGYFIDREPNSEHGKAFEFEVQIWKMLDTLFWVFLLYLVSTKSIASFADGKRLLNFIELKLQTKND